MSRVRNATGRIEKELQKNPGAPVPQAAVIGAKELQRWQEIVGDHSGSSERELRQTKKAISDERKANWQNTVEGQARAKEVARLAHLEEAEARRRLIDDEEASLRAAQRQATVDEANRQLLERDERSLQLKSQLLLHDVLEEREWQLQLSARKKQLEKDRAAEEHEKIVRNAEMERIEKQEAKLANRESALLLAEDRRRQLEAQIQQKQDSLRASREEGQSIRLAAEADVEKNRSEKALARQKAREVAVAHQEQLKEKVARTPRRTEGTVGDDPVLEERNLHYALRKRDQVVAQHERLQAKREAKDVKRQMVAENHEGFSPKKELAIDLISSGRSISDSMCGGDSARVSARSALQKSSRAQDAEMIEKKRQHRGNQVARERMIQDHIAHQIKEQESYEQEEKVAKKRDLQALQRFHELQARQKKVNETNYVQSAKEEGVHMQALKEEEDAMFSQYIKSQLPANVNPTLAKQAAKTPRALLAS